jgi:hypothetical protein
VLHATRTHQPQEQGRVTYVALAAVSVFLIVGGINMPGIINSQQLWCAARARGRVCV